MKTQDNILDDSDHPPKKRSLIKMLLITGVVIFILVVLEAMRFLYQFKDTTDL